MIHSVIVHIRAASPQEQLIHLMNWLTERHKSSTFGRVWRLARRSTDPATAAVRRRKRIGDEEDRMRSRLARLLAPGLVVILAASACGGAGGEGAGSTEPTDTGVETGSTTATEDSQGTDISGSFMWDSWKPITEEAADLIARFNAEYPNVEVDYQFEQYSDYINNLRLSMAAGEGPDLWFAQSGAFISEYAEFAEDLRPYAEAEWGEAWEDRFLPSGLSEGEVDGRIVGLPWMLLGAGYIWYNAGIFAELDLEPPSTLDEFEDISNRLRDAGVTPYIHGGADNWINFDLFMAIANQVAPGDVYRAEAGEVAWDSPGLVAAVEIWQELFDGGIMDAGALGIQQYPDASDIFAVGDAAMIMQGTWQNRWMTNSFLAELRETYGNTEDFTFLPFQFPDVDEDGEPASLTVGPDAIPMMNASAENKDAVWAFIAFLMSDEVQLSEHASNLIPPAVTGVELDRSDIATAEQNDALNQQAELLAAAIHPREFNSPDTQSALGDALQQVASGASTPKEALGAVQAQLQG